MSTETPNDGGPAFPFVSHGGVHEHQACLPGMSLRDAFAIQSAQALIIAAATDATSSTILKRAGLDSSKDVQDFIACQAYEFADAMLRAREAKPKPIKA